MIFILPWLAFLLALAAAGAALWQVRRRDVWVAMLRDRLLLATAVAAATTLLVLVFLFLVTDVSYEHVFLYSHADLPLRYRLAGTWAGREGSLALWAAYSAIVPAWLARHWRSRETDWTMLGLAGLSAAFLGAVAWQDTFARTPEFFLQQRPLGNGLNPTLQSDFFLIHPPLMFLAYALTHVPAAAALGHVASGHGQWSHAERAVRLDWLLYTVAMGLGGIWAYYTLGFGGYWAWDPVEVANLLPWLALTVYLHARLHHARHGSYRSIGPLLAMLPFALTLFSTISTRSGLWVSVHAFTDPTQTFDPDAPGRFMDILEVEPALAFYVGLALAVMAAFLALWTRRLAMQQHVLRRTSRVTAGVLLAVGAWAALAPQSAWSALAQAAHDATGGRTGLGLMALAAIAVLASAAPVFASREEGRRRFDLQGLNYVAILVLGAGLLVLVLWHFAAANGWSTAFYEARLVWLAAPAAAAITTFMLHPLGKPAALTGAGASLVLAAGDIWVPGLGIALAAGLLVVAALWRLRLAAAGPWRGQAQIGRAALALGALLDLLFWLNPPSQILGVAVRWPAQLVLGALALWAWHGSLRWMAGGGRHAGRTHALVFLLGGFYVAPLLAALSWLLHRRGEETTFRPQRMAQAGLYAVHLAVGIALLGYATSTYFGDEEQVVMANGESRDVAGLDVQLAGGEQETADGVAVRYHPAVMTRHGTVAGTLYWEPGTGSYYPLPATLRTWHGDVFLAIDGICFAETCEGAAWLRAYDATFQRPAGLEVTQVQFTLHTLPGLGLVWLALAVFAHGMLLRMAHSGEALTSRKDTLAA